MDSNQSRRPRKYERVVRQPKYSFISLEVPLFAHRKEFSSSNSWPSKIWVFIKPPGFLASITPPPRTSSGNTRKTAPYSSARRRPSNYLIIAQGSLPNVLRLRRPRWTKLQKKISQRVPNLNRTSGWRPRLSSSNRSWCPFSVEWCCIIGVDIMIKCQCTELDNKIIS